MSITVGQLALFLGGFLILVLLGVFVVWAVTMFSLSILHEIRKYRNPEYRKPRGWYE